jgi:hypothetical protein
LAEWSRLEETDSDLPESRRQALVRIQADPGAPYGVAFYEVSLEHGRRAPDYVERHLHTLPDAELLGVVLAGGCVQEESTGLARALLGELGGLSALPGASGAMLRHGGLCDARHRRCSLPASSRAAWPGNASLRGDRLPGSIGSLCS